MKNFILTAILLTFSLSASANYLECVGKIEKLVTSKTGNVSIVSTEAYGSNVARDICNIETSWKNIGLQTCKNWVSQALTAYAAQKAIRIVYTSSAYTTCSGQLTWDNAEAPHTIANW